MSEQATTDDFASRPKIHRLPFMENDDGIGTGSFSFILSNKKILLFSSVGLAILTSLLLTYNKFSAVATETPEDNDKRLLSVISSDTTTKMSNPQTISIKEKNEYIVGQIVRISYEPTSNVETANAAKTIDKPADKNTNKDLLTIVSKLMPAEESFGF